MEIRPVTPADAQRLLEIYAPYVEHTAVSFEYTVPDVQEFRRRIEHTLESYPYLAALEDGRIIGYAYAGAFHPREAYRHCAETSIYIDMGCRRRGAGRALYARLEELLRAQNVYSAYACIAVPDAPDEYLTEDSMRFHAAEGYKTVGRFDRCGWKFSRWYSMIWMEKQLCPIPDKPAAFIPLTELRD